MSEIIRFYVCLECGALFRTSAPPSPFENICVCGESYLRITKDFYIMRQMVDMIQKNVHKYGGEITTCPVCADQGTARELSIGEIVPFTDPVRRFVECKICGFRGAVIQIGTYSSDDIKKILPR